MIDIDSLESLPLGTGCLDATRMGAAHSFPPCNVKWLLTCHGGDGLPSIMDREMPPHLAAVNVSQQGGELDEGDSVACIGLRAGHVDWT